MVQSSSNSAAGNVVLFPFMSKGHTIPVLHFARHLFHRHHHLSITIITTPANHPFIARSLSDISVTIIDLSFPQNIPEIPPGVESTDALPSISLFPELAMATKLMQPQFEEVLQHLPNVRFLVSDGFLWWTLESASKFGIPRFVSYGMNNHSQAIIKVVVDGGLLFGPESDDELITVTRFPWMKVTRRDFDPIFVDPNPNATHMEFLNNMVQASSNSHGFIVNSFAELEPAFLEFWNTESKPKAWCVGPLCLAEPPKARNEPDSYKPSWIQWLDKKLSEGRSVLYVAFGTQAEISDEQIKEIAIGLEKSGVNFLWLIRKKESEPEDGFEERVKERGILVREWVDQREVLMHESVDGFLSHCGWNSVLESICCEVPILAWPMMAEQHLNARMVVEEIKIGLRVETRDGSVRGFVKWQGLEKMVRELMQGDKGKEVRKRVKEVADMARKAMEEGGSSLKTLDALIDEMCNRK